MHLYGAHGWHIPHYLRHHAKSHYYLQIGIQGTKGLQEIRGFHFFRLQKWYCMIYGILLYSRGLQLLAPAGRLIGHSDYGHNICACIYQAFQAANGEIGRTKKYDP